MVEQILRNVSFPGNYGRAYSLTENDPSHCRDLFSLKEGDRNLALKRNYTTNLSPFPDREKIYLENGTILRTCNRDDYTSVLPKSSTGHFAIYDGKIGIKGDMEKGKVVNLTEFFKRNKTGGFTPLMRGEGLELVTRNNIQELLNCTKNGTLELQNLTKVILKKCLAYLPK